MAQYRKFISYAHMHMSRYMYMVISILHIRRLNVYTHTITIVSNSLVRVTVVPIIPLRTRSG